MSELETRIQQFRQMAESDPENELGHFSLGRAYLEADQPKNAIPSLERVLQLRSTMSKAYQLLGEAYDRVGQRESAVDVMKKGIAAADQQGDYMPRDTMVKILKEWGVEPPPLKSASQVPPAGEVRDAGGPATDGFACHRCGQPGDRLERQPFRGELGERVFNSICQLCWREWIGMGTKVINELGLVLSSEEGQNVYDQYMIEFLQLEDELSK